MAKYALVHIRETRVQGIANNEAERFEVHPDMVWHKCPAEVEFMWEYDWVTGEFSPPNRPETNYTVARKVGYGDIGNQLDSIYKAIQTGESDPLASWAAKIEKVKILFPKDNQAAVVAANDELSRRVDVMLKDFELNGTPMKTPDALTQELADDYLAGRWDNPVTGPYRG